MAGGRQCAGPAPAADGLCAERNPRRVGHELDPGRAAGHPGFVLRHVGRQRIRQLPRPAQGGDLTPGDGLLAQHAGEPEGQPGHRLPSQRELRTRDHAAFFGRPEPPVAGRQLRARRLGQPRADLYPEHHHQRLRPRVYRLDVASGAPGQRTVAHEFLPGDGLDQSDDDGQELPRTRLQGVARQCRAAPGGRVQPDGLRHPRLTGRHDHHGLRCLLPRGPRQRVRQHLQPPEPGALRLPPVDPAPRREQPQPGLSLPRRAEVQRRRDQRACSRQHGGGRSGDPPRRRGAQRRRCRRLGHVWQTARTAATHHRPGADVPLLGEQRHLQPVGHGGDNDHHREPAPFQQRRRRGAGLQRQQYRHAARRPGGQSDDG